MNKNIIILERKLLLVSYIFVLLSVSFHHHPFKYTSLPEDSIKAGKYVSNSLLDKDHCAIIHFASNSFAADVSFDDCNIEPSLIRNLYSDDSFYKNTLQYLTEKLRAPPIN